MTTPELVNIAAHLPAMARQQPHALGVVFPHGRDTGGRVAYTHFTFQQLDRESNRLASGLEHFGLSRGMRTVLMVKPGLEFFALTFALFKMGAVPVFVDPGMGLKNLKKCLSEAQPEAFIGIPKAHLARKLLRWPDGDLKVTVGRRLFWGGITLDLVRRHGQTEYTMADTRREETAAILFTSGSTGVPKGAVYSHGTFAAQVAMLKAMYQIQPGGIDLATFPLFALFAPALGMSAIIPDMDATRPAKVDPTKIFEAIDNFGVTNMFGSPALLDTVSRYGVKKGIVCPSLKRVVSAGAPVQATVLERFSWLLSKTAEIHTPYGATESLPVATIGSAEILAETAAETAQGKGVCVGKPVDGMTLRIIRIDDGPIAQWSEDLVLQQGEIGEITVKGPVVTRSYYGREESTALAKIQDPGDGNIWHRMGDLGYLDDRGRVWFCGRKAHRVVSDDQTRYTVPVEGVFNAHPAVYRTALVGIADDNQQRPVLCVEKDKDAQASEAQIRQELLELGSPHEHTRAIRDIRFHPGFPVDIRHNAKIFREKLAAWAAK